MSRTFDTGCQICSEVYRKKKNFKSYINENISHDAFEQ